MTRALTLHSEITSKSEYAALRISSIIGHVIGSNQSVQLSVRRSTYMRLRRPILEQFMRGARIQEDFHTRLHMHIGGLRVDRTRLTLITTTLSTPVKPLFAPFMIEGLLDLQRKYAIHRSATSISVESMNAQCQNDYRQQTAKVEQLKVTASQHKQSSLIVLYFLTAQSTFPTKHLVSQARLPFPFWRLQGRGSRYRDEYISRKGAVVQGWETGGRAARVD